MTIICSYFEKQVTCFYLDRNVDICNSIQNFTKRTDASITLDGHVNYTLKLNAVKARTFSSVFGVGLSMASAAQCWATD